MRNRIALTIILIAAVFAGCRKDEISRDNKVNPGHFLSGDKYEKLIVEIQYVTGHAPTQASVTNLKNFLEQRLNKPDGITIVQTAISSPGKSFYSINDIEEIEKNNRTQHTNGKTLTAYFFFADGDYAGNSGNSKVLGIAYESSSMVIFQKTVKDHSGGIAEPPVTTLETTVLLHEFGHILGLVNNGTSMQSVHQDEPHGHHCNNQDCLMYYTAETTDILANLTGGNVPSLDAQCIQDLRANGGK
jgi:hypothetical protein